MIGAVKLVHDRLEQDIQCYIVGEGKLRSQFERQIKELDLKKNITLVGQISPQELPFWYSAADLFCLFSHSEGYPSVIVESLACGTPVIATDVGGVQEAVEEEVTGLLIRNHNVEDAYRQIQKGLVMNWDRSKIKCSRAVLDWSEVACSHAKVLIDVVAQA